MNYTINNKINLFIIIFLLLLYNRIIKVEYIKSIINDSKPKISIFLPIYNKANFLKRSITSIQIQTLRNIEIIAINDCSNDNSLEILNKLAEKDSRIKIVNNKKNLGLLFSRAIGVLNSNGEYLMNLDPDDELKDSDNLEYLYKKAIKFKLDIITYGVEKKSKEKSHKLILCSNFNSIIYQPEIFISGNKNRDYLIWNKLVKKELFLNAYTIFKKEIYEEKWNYGEDEIWSSLIYKNAKSMICIKKIIYIYNINNSSLMRNKYNILYIKNLIKWVKMFTKILNNKNNKNFLFNRFNYLITLLSKNNTLLNQIKNNLEIKQEYIIMFKKIIRQYKYNSSKLKTIIDSLEYEE